jgi:uncharacterized protein (DUF1697 family)
MTVMVALLRGVNVGGKGRLAMAGLRAAAEACGYENVRTYIQSGNLVFVSPSASTQAVAERLRETIADMTQVQPEVIVRTRHELAAVVEQNPYARRGEDAAHLHVVFAGGEEEASLGSIDLAPYAPEEAVPIGRQLYLFLPTGMGRSKLAADLARQTGPSGTTRNWRTVNKLLEMADETPSQ